MNNTVLPCLYSRRTDGGLQQWQVEIWDNKYRTISGVVDGQLVTSEWTTCAGKNIGRANETTPEEQAYSEAKAKWTKKLEAKYSETVDNIEAERPFQPMLAKVYEDYEKDLFNADGSAKVSIYTQPKFDGLRCIATKNGLFSRNGKPFVAVPHIIDALAPIFEAYPDTILDGELYAHHLKEDFNKICSCVKRTKPSDEDFQTSQQIQYHIYDIPSNDGRFMNRSMDISTLVSLARLHNNAAEYILQEVETKHVKSKNDVVSYYEAFIDAGYEGSMIRTDGKYENKRSKTLLKYKSFQDAEFTILDIVEGSGNRSGLTGYMCFERNGVPFKSNVKGDRDFLRELLLNKSDYIGLTATVKYFNLTPLPNEVPRFPVVIKVARELTE